MPRASWKGFLRLSLVSCPVYLMPATTKTKSIRLNQVWMPRTERDEPDHDEDDDDQSVLRPSARGIEPPPPGGQSLRTEGLTGGSPPASRPIQRDPRERVPVGWSPSSTLASSNLARVCWPKALEEICADHLDRPIVTLAWVGNLR
jgi:hypothetical protein